jgi:hypothetical protein
MTKLEYLMIYTESGLPIYSKCFGGFCRTAFKNPEMLSGLLSAIETNPPTLSAGLSLDSIRMGDTQMRFSKKMPSGHSIVIGLSEDAPEVVQSVSDAVGEVLGLPRFRHKDWGTITRDDMDEFKEELLKRSLVDALHNHGGFEDACPLGDQCPMHTDAVMSRRDRIWNSIKSKYRALREKMSGK